MKTKTLLRRAACRRAALVPPSPAELEHQALAKALWQGEIALGRAEQTSAQIREKQAARKNEYLVQGIRLAAKKSGKYFTPQRILDVVLGSPPFAQKGGAA